MDRNTFIGFALIGLLIIGFNWISRPSDEQIAEMQRQEQLAAQEAHEAQQVATKQEAVALLERATLDSALLADKPYKAIGEARKVTLENSKIKLQLSTLGGMPQYVEIKGHKNHKDGYEKQDTPVVALFQEQDNSFNLPLLLRNGEHVNTAECYFSEVSSTDSTCVMRLALNAEAYLDFSYKLNQEDYRVDFSIGGVGLATALSPSNSQLLEWRLKLPQLEQSHRFEGQYSGLYYGQKNGDVNDLSTASKDEEQVAEPLRWFAFKDKYFSSVLINKQGTFDNSQMEVEAMDEHSGYVRAMSMKTSFAYNPNLPALFTYYFGPNDYNILKGYDAGVEDNDRLKLDHLVYLGWSIFRSINRWLIIPVVDFLKDYIGSWGIIILLLTIFIKTLLFPFTYKSQVSQAKMRVLKPQVDEINKKYEGKTDQDAMLKKQRETMALYSSVGASPMSGCLPMLLQMPFLIALYMYFPTSIYLRGQSFLWADDLSTYDPVLRWDFDIPIIGGLLGNHISLFCLLMTIVNVVYNRYMMTQSSPGSNDAMAGMKYMPYMMSIMFFFMFNQNASGLSYYYFISTLITIVQFFAIRASISEEKILRQMEENKKKPKKKSGNSFMERLERMQREQMEAQRKAGKR